MNFLEIKLQGGMRFMCSSLSIISCKENRNNDISCILVVDGELLYTSETYESMILKLKELYSTSLSKKL